MKKNTEIQEEYNKRVKKEAIKKRNERRKKQD
jgi:hypothetical protein